GRVYSRCPGKHPTVTPRGGPRQTIPHSKARSHCWQSDATSAVREWSRRGQGIPQAGREHECPRATRIHRRYCQGLKRSLLLAKLGAAQRPLPRQRWPAPRAR
ncbi:hypothetical protein THAR02_05262, partial [Trichoderma harzianum]